MARVCNSCGKSYVKVTKRSHSMRGTHTRLQPNLQYVKVDDGRIRVCTRCMRTIAKKAEKATA